MTWYEKAGTGYRARFPIPGKRPGAGPVKPTKDEARAWAIQHGHDKSDIETLADLIGRWRAVKNADGHTTDSYHQDVERDLTALAKARKWKSFRDVTMTEVDRWKTDTKGIGVARQLSYLLAVLRWGWRQYGLEVDARVLKHRTPKAPRKVMADVLLTDVQVGNVQEAADGIGPSVGALVHYLATYGPRPITAITRKVGHVDLIEGTILVDGKRSGQWRHALLPDTLERFAPAIEGRGREEPLFLDPRTGKGWAVNGEHEASQMCSWYTRRLGKPHCGDALKGIYNLKRYAITGMLKRGMDPATVAKFTGHLTLSQVLLYARGNERTTKEALDRLCVPTTQNTQPRIVGSA